MKKLFSTIFFLSLLLVGNFGISNDTKAFMGPSGVPGQPAAVIPPSEPYVYGIKCKPGEMVGVIPQNAFASGWPYFLPANGKEVCLLPQASLDGQFDAGKIKKYDLGMEDFIVKVPDNPDVTITKDKWVVSIQFNPCKSVNATSWSAPDSDKKISEGIFWKNEPPCKDKISGQRRRYKIFHPVLSSHTSYLYVLGPWKAEEADKGATDYAQKNVVCSSVLEKIKATCKDKPELCASTCNQYKSCIYFSNSCVQSNTLTQEQLRALSVEAADSYLKAKYPVPDGYLSKILPDCAFHGTCRSLDDLLVLGINIAKFLFGIIGTIAFLMFIYGGFRMMLSMGSPDAVKQGKDAMVHAVIGIIISFSAYLIISFILNIFQVGGEFRAIGMIIKYLV